MKSIQNESQEKQKYQKIVKMVESAHKAAMEFIRKNADNEPAFQKKLAC